MVFSELIIVNVGMARQLQRLCRGRHLLQPVLLRESSLGLRLFSSDHIPVPTNVEELDAGQKAQFSRQRSRDLSALQAAGGSQPSPSMEGFAGATDAHVGSYDCSGALSLHSVMQTNVPEPFAPSGKAPSHLNMPGGQWGQEDKYLAQDRQDAHAAANTPLPLRPDNKGRRGFCTLPPLSRKDQLKRAVKEYGATVVVFHVGISLLSLGGCYLAVSSGLDVAALLGKLGLDHQAVAGASTFVVAYAVHKVFAPLRISVTLGAAPFLVRYLRRHGVLKPPKST